MHGSKLRAEMECEAEDVWTQCQEQRGVHSWRCMKTKLGAETECEAKAWKWNWQTDSEGGMWTAWIRIKSRERVKSRRCVEMKVRAEGGVWSRWCMDMNLRVAGRVQSQWCVEIKLSAEGESEGVWKGWGEATVERGLCNCWLEGGWAQCCLRQELIRLCCKHWAQSSAQSSN